MIVEHRTYTFAPLLIKGFLELYEARGHALHRKHLGRLVGYYTTEIGELGEIVQLWAFDDYADRSRRRAALWSDPAWLAFSAESPAPLAMHSRILVPTAFSPPPAG